MAEKMTRRTFMKSAAAAAAAISLSGVLTGCGGSGQLADDEVQIGPFTVKVFGLDVDLGTESGTDKGAITGKVRLRYDAGGGSWQGGQYGDMFQAFVGEAKLKQVSPAGTFFVSDTLLGKPFATEEKDLRLNFPDAEIKEAYRNGQPAVLKIVIKLAAAFEAAFLMSLRQRPSRLVLDSASMQPPRPCLPLPRFDPQTLLPRAFFERVPGAFCRSAQPENGIFGIFILFVKFEYRLFMPALRRLDTAAGACAKALPPFCAYMVAAHTAVRYNKAVPKENT